MGFDILAQFCTVFGQLLGGVEASPSCLFGFGLLLFFLHLCIPFRSRLLGQQLLVHSLLPGFVDNDDPTRLGTTLYIPDSTLLDHCQLE